MGKGFNNYMCKKFFHPASRDNLKRVWMAEQKAESYKKKQEELRVQYEKEQDLYTNKAMLSKESKDKLSVNFMYEPPPGTKKEREREDDEPEYKFEWQRKFNAPREDYCKGDSEIRDQPFGIQVRNVRCIKCHKWGHINTDKECPLYNQSSSADQPGCSVDPLLLVQQMREDGLAMKRSALELHFPGPEEMTDSEEDSAKLKDSEIELLKSLSKKQKQKLLRKFKKLERESKNNKDRKKKKSKKKKKLKKVESATSDESSDSSEEERKSNKKLKSSKRKEKNEVSHSSYIEKGYKNVKSHYSRKDNGVLSPKKEYSSERRHRDRSCEYSEDRKLKRKAEDICPQNRKYLKNSYNGKHRDYSSSSDDQHHKRRYDKNSQERKHRRKYH